MRTINFTASVLLFLVLYGHKTGLHVDSFILHLQISCITPPNRPRRTFHAGHLLFNVQFDMMEDPTRLATRILHGMNLFVFLMNTGGVAIIALLMLTPSSKLVLDEGGKVALQQNLDLGGNFAAAHSASDCPRNGTFYGRLVGVVPSEFRPTSWRSPCRRIL